MFFLEELSLFLLKDSSELCGNAILKGRRSGEKETGKSEDMSVA